MSNFVEKLKALEVLEQNKEKIINCTLFEFIHIYKDKRELKKKISKFIPLNTGKMNKKYIALFVKV